MRARVRVQVPPRSFPASGRPLDARVKNRRSLEAFPSRLPVSSKQASHCADPGRHHRRRDRGDRGGDHHKGPIRPSPTLFNSRLNRFYDFEAAARYHFARGLHQYNKRKDISEEDADAIFRLCTVCWRMGIVANDVVNTKHGSQKNDNVQMRAIKPNSTFDIDGVSLDAGRYWSDAEGDDAREVAVVGADIVTNSFPGQTADQVLGQQLWAGGRPYLILGVLQPLGKILGASRDNIIYVPFATYKKNFGVNVKRGAFIAASVIVMIQTQSAPQLEAAEDQVRAIMRNRRGRTFSDEDDGFALETQDVFLNLYSRQLRTSIW